jgi:hypothetical protein
MNPNPDYFKWILADLREVDVQRCMVRTGQ